MSSEINIQERGKIHRIINGPTETAIVLKHVVKVQYMDDTHQTVIYLVDGTTHTITTTTSTLYEKLIGYLSIL